MKTALIIGVNGQDGSYLAEHLLACGDYAVHGTVRRSSLPNLARVEHLRGRITFHWADLTDSAGIFRLVSKLQPDEVYNLGAMSDVRVSFDVPHYTGAATGLGATSVLEAVRLTCPGARYYQAGSSEMFGRNPEVPTNEESLFQPASPYAAAKVYAHQMTSCYREALGLHAVNGILFNHESPRRGVEFVTRKVTLAASAIYHGRSTSLRMGNLDAKRDWGFAPEYMAAAHAMMQAPEPSDYVIATGETHSVRELLDRAFGYVNLDWKRYVEIDDTLMRPLEVPLLLGDASKAKRQLGWEPRVTFDRLVEIMMESDLA